MKEWKKAVFTVEAAVIVPLAVTMIAALIGFCFYIHQCNWCEGAAYESILKSVERGVPEKERKGAAERRINARVSETPVMAGTIETDVKTGARVSVSWRGTILEEVFGTRFGYSGSASLTDFDPVTLKRAAFIIKGFGEKK